MARTWPVPKFPPDRRPGEGRGRAGRPAGQRKSCARSRTGGSDNFPDDALLIEQLSGGAGDGAVTARSAGRAGDRRAARRLRERFGTYPQMFEQLLDETDFDPGRLRRPARRPAGQRRNGKATSSPRSPCSRRWLRRRSGSPTCATSADYGQGQGGGSVAGLFRPQMMADAFGERGGQVAQGWGGIGLHDYALRGPSLDDARSQSARARPRHRTSGGTCAGHPHHRPRPFSEMGIADPTTTKPANLDRSLFDPACAKALIEGRREHTPKAWPTRPQPAWTGRTRP